MTAGAAAPGADVGWRTGGGDAGRARRQVAVLVRLELRRLRPPLLRMAATLAAGVPLLLALEARSVLLFVLLGFGPALSLQLPGQLVRDRIRGDLLFLSLLPIPAGRVVTAKFLAAALLSVPAAAMYGGAAALTAPDVLPSLSPGAAAAGAFLLAWPLFTLSTVVALALAARVPVPLLTDGSLPLALLAGIACVGWLFERWIPDPGAGIASLPGRSWLPPVAGTLAVGLAVAAAWVAWRVSSAAIRDYRPVVDSAEA